MATTSSVIRSIYNLSERSTGKVVVIVIMLFNFKFTFSSNIIYNDIELPSQQQPKNIPVMTRDYSLVVFGATGFTGQYVAEEVARVAEEENITWAIAGRNSEKLNAILENVRKVTGMLVFIFY